MQISPENMSTDLFLSLHSLHHLFLTRCSVCKGVVLLLEGSIFKFLLLKSFQQPNLSCWQINLRVQVYQGIMICENLKLRTKNNTPRRNKSSAWKLGPAMVGGDAEVWIFLHSDTNFPSYFEHDELRLLLWKLAKYVRIWLLNTFSPRNFI